MECIPTNHAGAYTAGVMKAWYRHLFSVQEIEQSLVLQWVFGATLFSYFIALSRLSGAVPLTIEGFAQSAPACWPHFQTCYEVLFLHGLPYGYSQTTLHMLFMAVLIGIVYLIFKKEWVYAHALLIIPFVWHVVAHLFLSGSISGNYDYYLILFAGVLLFFPHKEFFLKLALVWFYFLSTVIKIDAGWILGTYFSSLKTGLPLSPDWAIPLYTNVVIAMEMVGAWFLLSTVPWRQRVAVAFFAFFHVYSGILVEYRYPATVLPTLLILFGPLYRHTPVPLDRPSIPGWILLGLLLCMQFVAPLIPGDEKLTLEGNKYGLYMFEANHQCVSTARIISSSGKEEEMIWANYSARNRCDPYTAWFALKMRCKNNSTITSMSWTFVDSVNGGPFLRIVDVPEACALEYQPFTHNAWIKSYTDNPQIIGYPLENYYD
ncbi:MAG: hypothetical protein JW384_04080 [Nitrosomonadaceae bacterium]|nr:hypothetical protein [Nitrosomonadaceae bacterium]